MKLSAVKSNASSLLPLSCSSLLCCYRLPLLPFLRRPLGLPSWSLSVSLDWLSSLRTTAFFSSSYSWYSSFRSRFFSCASMPCSNRVRFAGLDLVSSSRLNADISCRSSLVGVFGMLPSASSLSRRLLKLLRFLEDRPPSSAYLSGFFPLENSYEHFLHLHVSKTISV